jgi:hypothetical protein
MIPMVGSFPGCCAHAASGHAAAAAEQANELAPLHVWMAPAWQEITSRAAQKSLAVMCPACSRSPDGLLALIAHQSIDAERMTLATTSGLAAA